jgi:glycine cleavage system H protein
LTEVPGGLRYARAHQWVKVSGKSAIIGVTDFAQKELNQVVFAELPEVGAQFNKGAQIAALESVKARSEIPSPVSGKVVRVNSDLVEGKAPARPELVNDGPYSSGWLVEIEMSDPSELDELLTPEQYRKDIEAKSR